MAMMLHDAATQRGEEDAAARIRVDVIYPALAALRDADAWEWHERCEVCGGFMRPGERAVGIEDGGGAHAACMGLSDQGRPIDGPEHDGKVIAEARELFALD